MMLVTSQPFETPEHLRFALQRAIVLEHATVPPYLTALFSLGHSNGTVRSIIADVVLEEMAHMAIAANVLNALGGEPGIVGDQFVPKYPGGLPMHIADSDGTRFEVGLAPFSIDLVRSTFLLIEQPEHPIEIHAHALAAKLLADDFPDDRFMTIGAFYQAISSALRNFGQAMLVPDANRQVSDFELEGVEPILSVDDALRGIDLIRHQGEGTETSPLAGMDISSPAHFYRFQQIVEGRMLAVDKNALSGYSFSGATLAVDESGILPLLSNPKSGDYQPGSPARQASDEFNRVYGNVLSGLQDAFNGRPETIDGTHRTMDRLRSAAVALMQIEVAPGRFAAPTFEPLF